MPTRRDIYRTTETILTLRLGQYRLISVAVGNSSQRFRGKRLRNVLRHSVFDGLDAESFKLLKMVHHGFELFRGVALPIRDLTGDPQRIAGAI